MGRSDSQGHACSLSWAVVVGGGGLVGCGSLPRRAVAERVVMWMSLIEENKTLTSAKGSVGEQAWGI